MIEMIEYGEKGYILKTAVPETVPGVRIPLPPPLFVKGQRCGMFVFRLGARRNVRMASSGLPIWCFLSGRICPAWRQHATSYLEREQAKLRLPVALLRL